MGIVGLGWIIVDLSRCKMEKKRNTRGVDVMIKVFISLKYNTYILSIAAKVIIQKGGMAIASSKTLKIFISSWFPSSSIRLGVLAACMLCSMLFSLLC